MGDAPDQTRRFVVLRHDGIERPHFDLMIESQPGGPLETWRCNAWPIEGSTELIQLPPHRRAYLDYEGPISGNRGYVSRVEAGTCRVNIEEDGQWIVHAASSEGRVFNLRLQSSGS